MSGTTVKLLITAQGVVGIHWWTLQRERWLQDNAGDCYRAWNMRITREPESTDRYGEFWIRDEALATQFILRWA